MAAIRCSYEYEYEYTVRYSYTCREVRIIPAAILAVSHQQEGAGTSTPTVYPQDEARYARKVSTERDTSTRTVPVVLYSYCTVLVLYS